MKTLSYKNQDTALCLLKYFFLGVFCSSTLLVLSVSNLHAEELSDEEYDDEQLIDDPLEDINRGIFWFNDQLDIYILEPVAEGYTYVVPKPVRRSVGNFFDNLRYPVYLVSDLVQLKFDQAGEHTGRFMINSVFGIAGLFDVASDVGLERHVEDFGIALGYHGVGTGPYLVLPFLGPSNARDLVGSIVDRSLSVTALTTFDSAASDDAIIASYAASVLDLINTRADLLEAVKTAKDASIDYYSFVKNSYTQRRESLIYDGFPPEDDYYDDEEE